VGFSQLPSEYYYLIDSFPDKDYVYLLDKVELEVKRKKDSLDITEKSFREEYYTSNKSGLYAKSTMSVSYFEELKNIEAYSLSKYNEDDKYKKYKVKDFVDQQSISNSVFYDDLRSINYEFPNLKKESIAYSSYTKKQKTAFIPFIEYFSYYAPVLKKELSLKIDNDIDFDISFYNMNKEDVNYSVEKKKKYSIHRWTMENIKPYKIESSSPSYQHLLPHLIIRITSYKKKDGERVGVLNDENDLYNWYAGFIAAVDFDSTASLQKILDEEIINESLTKEEDKVKAVFQWVQTNIKYIALSDGLGGFIPRDPHLVLSRRYGDCKDMSVLMHAFLRLLDIESHLTWVGTRDLPYTYKDQPSAVVDNHMILTYVNKNTGENTFLDATNSYLAYGIPNSFIQGKEAMIQIAESFVIDTVPVLNYEENLIIDTTYIQLEDDVLKGSGTLITKAYFSSLYKNVMDRITSDIKLKSLVQQLTEKGNNRYEINDYSISKTENEIIINYLFSLRNYVSQNKDEVYVNLNLDKFLYDFEIIEEDRINPYEYTFKQSRKSYFILEIPQNYSIKYIPEKADFTREKFAYTINYKKTDDNKIHYELYFYRDLLILEPADFEEYNAMIKDIKKSFQENIVLIKNQED
jgi:transglutaminase-like putative cysteine protease